MAPVLVPEEVVDSFPVENVFPVRNDLGGIAGGSAGTRNC